MKREKLRLTVLALLCVIWLSSSCGAELGVHTVKFSLHSMEPAVGGSGSVEVDVENDIGVVTLTNLLPPSDPDYPPGFVYAVVLRFAPTERAGIPQIGGSDAHAGHSHGALSVAGGVAADGLSEALLGEATLNPNTGSGTIDFSSQDLPGFDLGALRGANVYLVAPDEEDVTGNGWNVLMGNVTAQSPTSGSGAGASGGHSHGA